MPRLGSSRFGVARPSGSQDSGLAWGRGTGLSLVGRAMIPGSAYTSASNVPVPPNIHITRATDIHPLTLNTLLFHISLF